MFTKSHLNYCAVYPPTYQWISHRVFFHSCIFARRVIGREQWDTDFYNHFYYRQLSRVPSGHLLAFKPRTLLFLNTHLNTGGTTFTIGHYSPLLILYLGHAAHTADDPQAAKRVEIERKADERHGEAQPSSDLVSFQQGSGRRQRVAGFVHRDGRRDRGRDCETDSCR